MTAGSPLQHWGLRFFGGIALLALGGSGALLRLLHLPAALWPLSVVVGFVGFRLALAAAGPLARLVLLQRRAQTEWNDAARNAFMRASLPRRIYYLLASVAAADGPMSAAERLAIRHFVLERFADKFGFTIITPSNPEQHGCQISVLAHRNGRALFEWLTQHGVITDWREPNVIRMAPVPFYNSFTDVYRLGELLDGFSG
jgi:hypothetical protein